jgi:hypothetical protein
MKQFFLSLLLLVGGSLVAQDLSIEFRYNTVREDPGNYLSYISAIRYIAADKDTYDAVSGASKQKSTAIFAPIQTDIMGRATISMGFRHLLLFAVSADATRIEDAFHGYQEGKVITVEFIHRGEAFRIQTDKNSRINFPRGNYIKRGIGYITGHNPQVISRDFSADGTVATVDWNKVWDPNTPSERPVDQVNEKALTGPIQNDYGDLMAMFNWDGTLDVTLDQGILTIKGTLRPVKR